MIFELEMNLVNACALIGCGCAIIAAIIKNGVTKAVACVIAAVLALLTSLH